MWPFTRRKIKIEKVLDVMVEIPSLGFLGLFVESPNREYMLALSDSDQSCGVGGNRKTGHGSYILVRHGYLLCSGKVKRPNDGLVADNGTFVFADWLFGNSLKSILYAFASDGSELIKHTFFANILNTGLSDSGRFAVAQLVNSNHKDSGCLAFFDLTERKLIWKKTPVPGWADSYRFNDESERLGLVYQDKGVFDYSYNGEFIDSERWERERLIFSSGFELVLIVQEKLKQMLGREMSKSEADVLIKILNDALKSKLVGYPNEQAKAHRTAGEIYENLGETDSAIKSYEKALLLNPKVGVKRQLAILKKQRVVS